MNQKKLMKLLGIDYGSKNIGIAMSDSAGEMAFPKEIVANDEKALPHVLEIIENESIESVVLGESKNYEGKENPIMKDVHRFKEKALRRG